MPASQKSSVKAGGKGRSSKRKFGAATLVRIFLIHQRLCQERRVTAPQLAAELEVSDRTLKRDVALMRDQLGAPIEWDAEAGSYHYDGTCEFLPFIRLDPKEAFGLTLAARAFAACGAVPLGGPLLTALEKLAPLIGGVATYPPEAIDRVIVGLPAPPLAELAHFDLLVTAILERRELRITYRKPGAAEARLHRVQPVRLASRGNKWMLLAYDPAKKRYGSFLLVRLRGAEVTGQVFAARTDFDAEKVLRASMGRWFTGGPLIEVRVALAPFARDYLEETPWHGSQDFSSLPDGRLQMTLRLDNLVEVKNKILSWGEHAEVLSPPDLREEVRGIHARALARYA